MNKSDAITLLLTHAGLADGPRLRDGILGMLRPFAGIHERNFHEVIECIYLLRRELGSDSIDTAIPHSLLCIVGDLRGWATEPSSMLRRNNLINDDGVAKLRSWLNNIETTSIRYMKKLSDSLALSGYMEYLLSEDAEAFLGSEAVPAAIADSFHQDEDYKVLAVKVCTKYRTLGRQFGHQISSLGTQTVGPELDASVSLFKKKQDGR